MAQESIIRCNNFEKHLLDGFYDSFCREEFTDVSFAVGGQIFKLHRLVLSISSNYFRKMLLEMPNTSIYLKDVNANIFKDLIRFMYCGEVKVKNTLLSDFLSTAEALEIKGIPLQYYSNNTREPAINTNNDLQETPTGNKTPPKPANAIIKTPNNTVTKTIEIPKTTQQLAIEQNLRNRVSKMIEMAKATQQPTIEQTTVTANQDTSKSATPTTDLPKSVIRPRTKSTSCTVPPPSVRIIKTVNFRPPSEKAGEKPRSVADIPPFSPQFLASRLRQRAVSICFPQAEFEKFHQGQKRKIQQAIFAVPAKVTKPPPPQEKSYICEVPEEVAEVKEEPKDDDSDNTLSSHSTAATSAPPKKIKIKGNISTTEMAEFSELNGIRKLLHRGHVFRRVRQSKTLPIKTFWVCINTTNAIKCSATAVTANVDGVDYVQPIVKTHTSTCIVQVAAMRNIEKE